MVFGRARVVVAGLVFAAAGLSAGCSGDDGKEASPSSSATSAPAAGGAANTADAPDRGTVLRALLDEGELPSGFSVLIADLPYGNHEPPNTGSAACDLSETIGGFEEDAVARAYTGSAEGHEYVVGAHLLVRDRAAADKYFDDMNGVPGACPSWRSADNGRTYTLKHVPAPRLGDRSMAIERTSDAGDDRADLTVFVQIGDVVLAMRNTGTGDAAHTAPPEDLVRRQVEKIRSVLGR